MLAHPVFQQHYNSLIQMSKTWRKSQYTMSNIHLEIIDYILKKFHGTYQTIMFAPSIIFKCFSSWKIEVRYFRHSMLDFKLLGCVTITDYFHLWRKNRWYYIILYFHNVTINWYKGVGCGRNWQYYLLSFHWGIIYLILKKFLGILQTIMLAPSFPNVLVPEILK